ncbi:MBL fold metallo-hydrolase [Lignipirellula cremea]|uniref:MBL fold metallo-hydrolase n=1 Tax=Lignipirellula cremea TaxID=2528010 RepID=UPI001E53EC97|nr:MBL fold metallo-hydrolase [Lignipirellula cremea]
MILGTAGYRPNDHRQTTCVMLPESGVLLDAGTSIYRAAEYLTTDTLDIFLSHAHLDHIFGLTVLHDLLHLRPLSRVTLHAEAEKLAAVEQHLFHPSLFPVRPPLDTEILAAEVQLACGGRLTSFPVVHPGGARGYRIDWPDRSLAYVTDTTANIDAPYVQHIQGVDLLIHECHLPDGKDKFARLTGHSCLTPVAQVAAYAEVGRVVLIHMNPLAEGDDPLGVDNVKSIFPHIEVARDRQEFEF